jgi:hypothetical protein
MFYYNRIVVHNLYLFGKNSNNHINIAGWVLWSCWNTQDRRFLESDFIFSLFFSNTQTMMVIQFLIIFKYLKLAILSLDSDFFFPSPYTQNWWVLQKPNTRPHTGLDRWGGGGGVAGSLSGCKYNLHGLLLFGKRTPCHEVHCTQAQILDFPSFNFQSVKQICFKKFIYLFIWCGAGAWGGECDSKKGLKRCIQVLKVGPLQVNCWNR